MRIYRPMPFRKTVRVNFTKKIDGVSHKRGITIVDATKKQVMDVIEEVYANELERQDSNALDFVKVTVQILYDNSGKRAKDEFSYRLYRCGVDVIDKLIETIDNIK